MVLHPPLACPLPTSPMPARAGTRATASVGHQSAVERGLASSPSTQRPPASHSLWRSVLGGVWGKQGGVVGKGRHQPHQVGIRLPHHARLWWGRTRMLQMLLAERRGV